MDRIIYCWWTGSNEMSQQRRGCLKNMEETTGCKIVCLYENDIKNYIIPEHPLHPAYEYLSETQKGDYLKAYFMNFYGGGYTDIKKQTGSWVNAFDMLENSDKWIIGYRESDEGCVAGDDLIKKHWFHLIANSAYICKPQTPITIDWYNDMLSFLDRKIDLLKQYPATFPQDHAEISNGKYPIEWNELNGRIFHKICYKYKDHHKLLYNLPHPICYNYR
jgi:hypothetical protein